MADAYTEYLNLIKPEIGGSRDAWGQKINDSFDKIDAFAKSTNTLVSATVSKTATADQSIASNLSVLGLILAKNGLQIQGNALVAEGGIIATSIKSENGGLYSYGLLGNDGKGQLSLTKDGTRGLAFDGTQYQMPGAPLFVNGKQALVAGDVDLSPYFNKNTTARQEIDGTPVVTNSAPEYQILLPGVYRWGTQVAADGTLRFRNADDDDAKMTLSTAGVLWTKELGSVNQRIEDRAKAYAEDRANAVGNARVVAIALQGSWAKPTSAGQVSADHPGVVTGIGVGTNGLVVNITGRYVFFNTPSQGWVGAYAI